MKNETKKFMTAFAGLILTAFATGQFYIPNKLVIGGISGLSTILYAFQIPPGAVYAVMNLIILLAGIKVLGKNYLARSVISIIILSVFVELFSLLPTATGNIFLAAVFGGILTGVGTALTLIAGYNTGGTDIIGRIIQSRRRYFPIGSLIMMIDGIIILISLIIFKNIDHALYGIIGLIISSGIINYLIDLLNSSKLAFVITEKGGQVSKIILENSRRGVTVLNARGAYSGNRKNLLICALKGRQIPDFYKMITTADKDAFIIFAKSEKIFGSGFFVYE